MMGVKGCKDENTPNEWTRIAFLKSKSDVSQPVPHPHRSNATTVIPRLTFAPPLSCRSWIVNSG